MEEVTYQQISNIFGIAAAAIAVTTVAALLVSAIRSGVIRQLTVGPFSIEITAEDVRQVTSPGESDKPFESAALVT